MNAKYFKTLPEQEYIFKNFFTTGAKEGVCCADCGTYITNVVQLIGKADRQVYELGTTCCNKISKDRSIFLTPLSEQRKKIFINQFKKHQKIIAELEALAEEFGGAELRFADVDITYMQELQITVFIFCKNGYICFNHLDNCERDFAGLKELTKGFEFDLPFVDVLEKSWNRDMMFEIKGLVKKAWNDVYNTSLWEYWLYSKHPELKDKHSRITREEEASLFQSEKYKTFPRIF